MIFNNKTMKGNKIMKKIIITFAFLMLAISNVMAEDAQLDINAEQAALLSQLTTDSYQEALTWLRGTRDFIREQAPPICDEFLAWEMVRNTIYLLTFLISAVIFFCISRRTFLTAFPKLRTKEGKVDKTKTLQDRWNSNNLTDDEAGASIFAVIFCGATSVALTVFGGGPYLLIICQIHFAPRIHLIETIERLIS